jgi:hypothetical protein
MILSLALQLGSAAAPPRVPHYEWNACPFECCTYREWTATAEVRVLRERRAAAPVAFVLQAGDRVIADTGVVVTTKFGTARARLDAAVGRHRTRLAAGDEVTVTRYVGEGQWTFWVNGRFDSEEIEPADGSVSDLRLRMVSEPETTWWVRVRTRDGRRGWTTNVDGFEGKDACGC